MFRKFILFSLLTKRLCCRVKWLRGSHLAIRSSSDRLAVGSLADVAKCKRILIRKSNRQLVCFYFAAILVRPVATGRGHSGAMPPKLYLGPEKIVLNKNVSPKTLNLATSLTPAINREARNWRNFQLKDLHETAATGQKGAHY